MLRESRCQRPFWDQERRRKEHLRRKAVVACIVLHAHLYVPFCSKAIWEDYHRSSTLQANTAHTSLSSTCMPYLGQDDPSETPPFFACGLPMLRMRPAMLLAINGHLAQRRFSARTASIKGANKIARPRYDCHVSDDGMLNDHPRLIHNDELHSTSRKHSSSGRPLQLWRAFTERHLHLCRRCPGC